MEQQTAIWNTSNNPETIGNYVVDLGGFGFSLGWWNGYEWVKMWHNEPIIVYSWINTPNYNKS